MELEDLEQDSVSYYEELSLSTNNFEGTGGSDVRFNKSLVEKNAFGSEQNYDFQSHYFKEVATLS